MVRGEGVWRGGHKNSRKDQKGHGSVGGKRLRGDESEVRRSGRGERSKKASVKREGEASGKAGRHPGEVRGKGLKGGRRREVWRGREVETQGGIAPAAASTGHRPIPPACLAFHKHGLDPPCFLPVRDYPPFLVRMGGIKGRGEIKHGNVYIYLKTDCQRSRGGDGRREGGE